MHWLKCPHCGRSDRYEDPRPGELIECAYRTFDAVHTFTLSPAQITQIAEEKKGEAMLVKG